VRSREKVLKRLENKETPHRDFIWYIMQQQKRHELKTDEIVVNGALFIVAGTRKTEGYIVRILISSQGARLRPICCLG
jgi:hypothetical protein